MAHAPAHSNETPECGGVHVLCAQCRSPAFDDRRIPTNLPERVPCPRWRVPVRVYYGPDHCKELLRRHPDVPAVRLGGGPIRTEQHLQLDRHCNSEGAGYTDARALPVPRRSLSVRSLACMRASLLIKDAHAPLPCEVGVERLGGGLSL